MSPLSNLSMSRDEFVRELRANGGNLDARDPATVAAFREAGFTPQDVVQLAGPDGFIRGADFDRVFTKLDGLDHDGDPDRMDCGAVDRLTTAGVLAYALRGNVDADRAVAAGAGGQRF